MVNVTPPTVLPTMTPVLKLECVAIAGELGGLDPDVGLTVVLAKSHMRIKLFKIKSSLR